MSHPFKPVKFWQILIDLCAYLLYKFWALWPHPVLRMNPSSFGIISFPLPAVLSVKKQEQIRFLDTTFERLIEKTSFPREA